MKHYQKFMSLMFNKHIEYEKQLDMNSNKDTPSKEVPWGICAYSKANVIEYPYDSKSLSFEEKKSKHKV